jgi:SSS family solute:Na+ symporter
VHFIDYAIFVIYLLGVLAIGFYHFRRNKSTEDYYVGSRNIRAHHVGLSIVATDVGGGFSIGLGGVGFLMGLSGSWLLFTGLVGAWLTAVLVIPRIKRIDAEQKMFTYPDFLRFRYNNAVALLAAVISGIGYLGFTGGQIQAGATLASSTMIREPVLGMEPRTFALVVIAVITVLYTVIGGLKAVIYTDTIQWIILLSGLIFVTVPVTLVKIGGFAALREALPPEFFTLTNIEWYTYINWMVTIIPIWLIGMTLYQRMYACRDEKEARRAWYIAGIFEYPIMAFTGVFLGMCARVVFPEIPDSASETAMPRLIQEVLPVGVTGIVIASYFSAIMSTADSCLMAASGNFVNDVIERAIGVRLSRKVSVRLSMGVTLVIGVIATLLAARFETVLDAILLAYSFMVAGLFVPTLGAYFWKRSSSAGAFGGMLAGGLLTLPLIVLFRLADAEEPPAFAQGVIKRIADVGLDASLYGIAASAVVFIALSLLLPDRPEQTQEVTRDA